MTIRLFSAALAVAAAVSGVASASTIRFEYDSTADQTRTGIFPLDIIDGTTNTAAGQYKGTTAHVSGYLDLDLSGAAPVIVDYSLSTILPHGLPTGYADVYPLAGYPNPGPTASLVLTEANAADNFTTGALIHIEQEFQFDTRFGPQPPNMVYYDPTDDKPYPFLMQLTLQSVAGAGLDGGPAFRISRLQMVCNEKQLGVVVRNGCNGYTSENYGFWNGPGTSGMPSGMTAVSDAPVSTVPLPAALPLALTGIAALGFISRRRSAKA